MTSIGQSAEEICGLIARGALSVSEVAAEHLRALSTIQEPLNAVARLEPEAAEAAAEALKDAPYKGPLHGAPLAHKDLYGRAGWLHEAGSSILRGNRATTTAVSIKALDQAGALDLGRLNTVEFALGPQGLNAHTGPVRNPWNPAHLTGGSSSGSGAAVASGAVPAAMGSDTGGSIRLPAAACGVVGLKPTAGRIGRRGIFPLSATLDTAGPLATTVRDAALVTEAMCGYDPGDPQSAKLPPPDLMGTIEEGLEGMRIGVARAHFFDPVTATVGATLEAALSTAEADGAKLSDIAFPGIEISNRLALAIIATEAATQHRAWLAERAADYGPETRARLLTGLFIPAAAYTAALTHRRPLLAAALDGPFAVCDVVATPAIPFEVPLIEPKGPAVGAEDIGHCTRPFNYLGLPAVVVPIGLDGNGVPIAIQLVARPFAEAMLLRAARGIERALRFRETHKPRITAW